MRKSFLVGLAAASALALPVSNIEAQVPRYITFQGMLLKQDNTPVADGPHSIRVEFYPGASGGAPVHVEPISVNTVGGAFSTVIGEKVDIPTNADFKEGYWFEVDYQCVKIPRMKITTSPYALRNSNLSCVESIQTISIFFFYII